MMEEKYILFIDTCTSTLYSVPTFSGILLTGCAIIFKLTAYPFVMFILHQGMCN